MNPIVNVHKAMEELDIEPSEYLENVQEVKKYVNESYDDMQNLCALGNYSGLQEIAHEIREALLSLGFVSAAEVALQLEKSAASDDAGDPELALRELRQIVKRSVEMLAAM